MPHMWQIVTTFASITMGWLPTSKIKNTNVNQYSHNTQSKHIKMHAFHLTPITLDMFEPKFFFQNQVTAYKWFANIAKCNRSSQDTLLSTHMWLAIVHHYLTKLKWKFKIKECEYVITWL
jgi:hypothetical protein